MHKMDKQDPVKTALEESVHFSFKTVNSNIEKGGIRLCQSQAIDLPYISARTLLQQGYLIPTDYQANAGKTATYFKIVKAAMLQSDISEEEPEFQQQVAKLKPAIKSLFAVPYKAGTEHIDLRMRQLLLPKNEGQYLAISPVTAAGVNHLINQQVDEIKEQGKEKNSPFGYLQTAIFGIGGANPQNVGSLVRAMQRPITLNVPAADKELKQALAIFYQGFEYTLLRKIKDKRLDDKQALVEWAKILNRQLVITANDTIQNWHELEIFAPSTTLKVRQQEELFLTILVKDVLQQAYWKKRILQEKVNKLPSLDKLKRTSFWSHPDVSFIIQGLINEELRDDNWCLQFSNELAWRITQEKIILSDSQPLIDISLDKNAKEYLARKIRGILSDV